MSLHIATDLQLPDEAVTQTFAILAKRGVGKTYTASVMVEEMLKHQLHVAVVDPIGVWWGLRSSADGKRAGLPMVIAGGEHADVPIEPTSGELLAEMIVEKRVSMVIDLSLFRKGEQHRFMTDFAETLYRRNRQAVHLVLDEADEFAPQRPMGDEARMLGAIEDLVRRGRARGIGVTMITQRPAVLNKNVLTQIEVLVAMRLTSPQDRAAIAEWIKYHADSAEAQKMLESLGSLPIGTAWFWSPGWLNLFQKVAIRRRETFDSSSTPEVGAAAVQASTMAAVDIDWLREQLSATIKKAAADDPKVLRARIVTLERELRSKQAEMQKRLNEERVTRVEQVAVMSQAQVNELVTAAFSLIHEIEKHATIAVADIKGDLDHASNATEQGRSTSAEPIRPQQQKSSPPAPSRPSPQHNGVRADTILLDEDAGTTKLSRAARAILAVLAQHPDGRTKAQVSILSGYSIKSSSFANALGELRSAGLATRGEPIRITENGQALASDVEPLPSGEELLNYWRGKLGRAERSIFDTVLEGYPQTLKYATISERSGYSQTSSSFANALGKLRSLQLIEGYGEVRANDDLF